MDQIHFFTDRKDCEGFFRRLAKNNNEELTDNCVFEGNSGQKYETVRRLGDDLGYNRIGVRERDYEDESIDFCDTLFIDVNCLSKNVDTHNLHADETDLLPGGIIRVWWD